MKLIKQTIFSLLVVFVSSVSFSAYAASTVSLGTPSITVINPAGGTYKTKDTIQINWLSQNVPATKVVQIALISRNNDNVYVDVPTQGYCNKAGGCVPVSKGSLSYKIPSTIPDGDYKFRVLC